MIEKTKVVELSGRRYLLRRMSPEIGSYVLMQIVGGLTKALTSGGEPTTNESIGKSGGAAEKLRGEEFMRAVALPAFRGLDFDTHKFIQTKCVAACSRLEGDPEMPMPIVSDSGQWAIPEIRDDMSLVMRLEVESLVFNLAPFFEAGGLNMLAGNQPTPA